MSNQIVITSGAKVRNLSGVLTATSGVVDSVGLGTANGVATLDSNGKVPLSQLPASVVTYLGTWNAATNTPTLANGTGDIGDLYICNVAGTVNFGAGPITFAVGDWVIYNGSQWQKSAGASGTVTSVAMTVPTGLSVTGSPITTSGTLAVSLSSGYTIPTTSFLSGLVPYTGATQTVDLGNYDLNARGIKVNGTAGSGHVDFKHQSGTPTGSASSSTLYANTDGDLAWLNDHSHTITLAASSNTADRTYTFPNTSGTIALTSDISYPVTSVFGRTGAVTAQSGDYTTTQVTEGTNLYYTDARARGAISLTTTGTSGAATYNSTTGVLNVPNYGSALSGYVPYAGATGNVDLGAYTIKATKVFGEGTGSGTSGILAVKNGTGIQYESGYTVLSGGTYTLNVSSWVGSATQAFTFDFGGLSTARTYTMPNATGTLALTSDIPSLSGYVTIGTSQTITAQKTFSNDITFSSVIFGTTGYFTGTVQPTNGIVLLQSGSRVTGSGLTTISVSGTNGIMVGFPSGNFSALAFPTASTNTYTFPNATGTVALTSSLSGYLPLTGGTLTGDLKLDNGAADGAQLVLASSGFSDWNIDNFSGNFRWYYGATERMRLTASGNLGINTSDSWGISSLNALFINNTGGLYGGNGQMALMNNATHNGTNWVYRTNNTATLITTDTGTIVFNNATSGTAGNTISWNERMRITSTGNVGIGTSSPSQILHIYGSSVRPQIQSTGNGGYCSLRFTGNTSTGVSRTFEIGVNIAADNVWQVTDGSSGLLSVSNVGALISPFTYTNTTSNAANLYMGSSGTFERSTSSIKYKKDVIDYTKGLNEVLQLRPVFYKGISERDGNKQFAGLIAEEVHDLGLTEFVQYAEDGTPDALAYQNMIALLTKAIQELSAKVTALENKI